jgi:glutamate racemase
MKSADQRPVGIFDSGLGGLTIAKEIKRILPGEDVIFLADQANVPYGEKSEENILALTRAAVPMLIMEGAKAVIIACNSASVAILDELRTRYPDTAFIGVVPAIKPAAERSRAGTVAVFATRTTLRSSVYRSLKEEHTKNVTVVDIPCPTWVDMIESGAFQQAKIEKPVADALASGADVFVLGCTHFPFLRECIAETAGEGIELIDSGAAIARQLKSVLADSGSLNRQGRGKLRFLTSGNDNRTDEVASKLTGWTVRFQTVGH